MPSAEMSGPSRAPDEILFGPLAKLVKGPNSAMINTFFVGQLGDEAEIEGSSSKRCREETSEQHCGSGVTSLGGPTSRP